MNTSITRRQFLQTSGRVAGGVAALAVGTRLAAAEGEAKPVPLSEAFPRYEEFKPLVPVYCVTPKLNGCFHRFFNTSPISPSGRYLAVTRLACEDRLATPDEEAEVVLVDLQTGESRVLAKTKGFDSQLGAQAQWGATDNELFFNDLDTKQWRAFGVRMDPISGERRNLDGPVFEVTRDGKLAASICLARSAITQRGYGVVIPTEVLPWNEGAVKDDGVYLTDTATGACRLLVSYKDLAEACGEKLIPTETDRGGGYHGHQISWNPQGTRLWLALAFNYPQPMTSNKRRLELSLITLKPDGSDIHVALTSPVWRRQGGNHPCWCADGEHISMNFRMGENKRYSLVRMRYDGQDLAPLTPVVGTGHPTLHPDGRHIFTDTYQRELPGFEDGTIPLRWIDTADGTERMLVRIGSRPPYSGPFNALRVDPHPAWDRTYSRVAFNACPTGTRRVYVADIPREMF
ncbi:MAG: hypothetical protein NTW96_06520 [Planctomycetia bacterium]|nr:hypothetical protein [Planctomycetia bacterium]